VKYGVERTTDGVVIRNRVVAAARASVVFWFSAGPLIGVTLLVSGAEAVQWLVVEGLIGVGLAVWSYSRLARHRLTMDREGVHDSRTGAVLPWSTVCMVRAVLVQGKGAGLCIVGERTAFVPPVTYSSRRRRRIEICDACAALTVTTKTDFDLELFDQRIPVMPSREFLARYSVSSTAAMAQSRTPAPPVRRRYNRTAVALALFVVVGRVVVTVVWGHNESTAPPAPPVSFDLGVLNLKGEGNDLCHGVWAEPPGWPAGMAVAHVIYRLDTSVLWRLDAGPTGAIGFEPDGPPVYSITDLETAFGYRLEGTVPGAPYNTTGTLEIDPVKTPTGSSTSSPTDPPLAGGLVFACSEL